MTCEHSVRHSEQGGLICIKCGREFSAGAILFFECLQEIKLLRSIIDSYEREAIEAKEQGANAQSSFFGALRHSLIRKALLTHANELAAARVSLSEQES